MKVFYPADGYTAVIADIQSEISEGGILLPENYRYNGKHLTGKVVSSYSEDIIEGDTLIYTTATAQIIFEGNKLDLIHDDDILGLIIDEDIDGSEPVSSAPQFLGEASSLEIRH